MGTDPVMAYRRRQHGLNLVSVMVGMAISALGALVCTNILVNYEIAASEMQHNASHGRLISFGLLVAERQIINAGYGIDGADADDIVALSTPASASETASTSLLWRYLEAGAYLCRGLRDAGAMDDQIAYRTLALIGSPDDCNEASPLMSLAFDETIDVLGQWPVQNALADHIAANGTLFDFQISTSTCSPFGMLAPAPRLSVALSAPGIAELNGVALPRNRVELCLLNIPSA